jgi:hypothetical protein
MFILYSWLCRSAEGEDVFVGDDPQREPAGAGLADPIQLKEGRAGDQPVLPQPDQQGGVPFVEHEADRLGHLGELPGKIDELVAVAIGRAVKTSSPPGASSCWQPARISWRAFRRVGWLTRPRLAGSAE